MRYAFVSNSVFFLFLGGALLLGWLSLTPFIVFLLFITMSVAILAGTSIQALIEQKIWLKKQTYKKKSATEVLVPPKGLKTFLYALEHKTYQDIDGLFKLYSTKPYKMASSFFAVSVVGLLVTLLGFGATYFKDYLNQSLGQSIFYQLLQAVFAAPSPFVILAFGLVGTAAIYFSAVALNKAWRENLPLLNVLLPKKENMKAASFLRPEKNYKFVFFAYLSVLVIFGFVGVYGYYQKQRAAQEALYEAKSVAQAEKEAQLEAVQKKLTFFATENATLQQKITELEESHKTALETAENALDKKTAAFNVAEKVNKSIQTENNTLKKELDATEKAKKALEENLNEAQKKLKEIESAAQQLEEGTEESSSRLQITQDRLSALEKKHAEVRESLENLQEKVKPLTLEGLVKEKNLTLVEGHTFTNSGQTLKLPLDAFFAPQTPETLRLESAKQQEQIKAFMEKILKEHTSYQVLIAVHGDSLPPQATLYPTTEELTAAQAGKLLAALSPREYAARVYAIGMGNKQQLNDKLTEDALQENRRIEITFFKAAPCLIAKGCF